MLIIISIAAFAATMLGGLFALRLKDRLHLILGFSAGAIIGVAFFDLIPEALELGGAIYSLDTIAAIIAAGFLLYLVLDRLVLLHGHDDTEEHHHHRRGMLGAGSLSVHSFLDGLGVGVAFQVSPEVGAIVAAAVLTHGFSDGINTINLILKNKGDRKLAFRWLLVDAMAPVAGIATSFFLSLPEASLGVLLAIFSGSFLYIGASDLLPESHHAHPTRWTTISTVLGAAFVYLVVRLVH